MPSLRRASLLHAVHYMRLLYEQNQSYLRGGEEQSSSLKGFEVELPNLRFIQGQFHDFIVSMKEKQDLSVMDQAFLDVCNTIPDAGAYLISLKLNARERIRWIEDALRASRKLQNELTTQAHLGNLGLAHNELGELSQAIEYYQQAFHVAKEIGDRYHQGAWLGNLGNIYSLQGNHEKAIEYHQRHLDLMREIKNMLGEGHALANLGVSYAYLGQLPKAIENYKQHLSLATQLGDRREQSRALMNLGFAYFDAGNLDVASHSLNDALQIATDLGDTITQILVMGGLADIAIDRNEYVGAIQLLQDALSTLQNTHDVEAELRLIQSLGNAYSASDDFEQALQTYSWLYDLAHSIGAKAAMCSALANQTSLNRYMGDFAGAIRVGKQALELARQIQSLSDESFVRWQLALIDEANEEFEKAALEMNAVIEMEEHFGSLDVEKHREHLKNLIHRTGRLSASDWE